jgi:hypothetical protein
MKKTLLLTLALAGCATNGTEAPKPDAKQIAEMRAIAGTLATRLGGRLKQELEANGPESAISVCKKIAPQIAGDLSRQTGWTVGRVGTRARNANTGVPDAWETRALATFAERMKQGEKPETLELAEVVSAPSGGHTLRYAKAIAIQPLCVTCHGAPEQLPAGVKARLQAEYPLDQATGYRVGELRGAVVIKRPL